MPSIKVREHYFFVDEQGQGDPLLLIAGFTANHQVFDGLIKVLKHHFRVIYFDNRGTGQSSVPPGPYHIKEMAEDTLGILDTLSIQKTHVLGQSMGTSIAQYIAATEPTRVNKLILANAYPKLNTLATCVFKTLGDMIDANIDGKLIMDSILPWTYSNKGLRELKSRPALQAAIDLARHNPHPMTATGYHAQFAALTTFDNQQLPLSRIMAKTCVIAGECDYISPPSDARAVAAAIPDAQYHELAGLAHLCQHEDPDHFLKIVMDFLS